MNKKIVILLSTYNGEKYLKEQLDSIQNQSYQGIEIIARDDVSSDSTVEILKSYGVKLIETKQNLGAKRSFAELLKYAVANREAEYFMFCDQDDVWYSDKVEKTLSKIHKMENKFGRVPLLVHTNLEIVDENLHTLSSSMWEYEYILPQYNSLNRLLIQNTVTGCTVIINRALAKKCLHIPDNAIMHDWWIGLVASYFGKIGYIEESTIKYRQHSKNTIGAKGFQVNVLMHMLSLIKSLLFKDTKYINHMQINITQAKSFLDMFKHELDVEAKTMLQEFTTLEKKTVWQKRAVLWKYKLLKQGLIRNAGLLLKI